MCVVCGCSSSTPTPSPQAPSGRPAEVGSDLHYGRGEARVSVVGMSSERTIQIEQDVLGANQAYANENRAHFHSHQVLALNLVSSPGSGKTTLLCATVQALAARHAVAVIEGDQQTSVDADRIRATGVAAIQVNTGKGCHLDARMVGEAFARLPLHQHHEHALDHHHGDHDHGDHHVQPSVLMIENVGNLVCPALWDLGEAAKIVILSVTEGEDKPLKYPDMFAAARLMLINKVDLLPYVDFKVAQAIDNARRINPQIQVLQVSATQGQGMAQWLAWIEHELAHMAGTAHHHHDTAETEPDLASEVAQLKARLAKLEALLVTPAASGHSHDHVHLAQPR